MSIVSPMIAFQMPFGRTFANRGIAPQRRVRDFGEAPCPEFMMAETTARQSQSKKIMRPGNPRTNDSLGYVPLKCDQENSHAEGASLFNAPMGYATQLNVPAPVVNRMDATEFFIEKFPEVAPPYMIKKGIRPEPRFIKFSQITEPANDNPTRPYYKGEGNINSGDGLSHARYPSTTYDVGLGELRRSMRH